MFSVRRLCAALPKLPLLLGGLALVFYSVTRLGLACYTGLDNAPLSLWMIMLAKGLWFDTAVVACLLAPIAIYEAVLPNRWRHAAWHRVLRAVWIWLAIALLLFGAVSEVTFWMEFSTRFNFIALDYLIYSHEVIGNIRESYPVAWILIGIGVLAALILRLLAAWIAQDNQVDINKKQRLGLLLAAFVLPAALLNVANIEQMEGTHNAYITELSGNGLFTLAAAARRNELDYDKFYRTIPQAQANQILQNLHVLRSPLGMPRAINLLPDPALNNTPFLRKPKNIVLISVESLSASFMGAYGSTQDLTPRLDALAKQGLQFDHLFATGTRTVRGLEALSLGTPPAPGQAIVRRPDNEHLSTMGGMLAHQGYTSTYFYGGYGLFDNMQPYFSANDYQVLDRTSLPKDDSMVENIWGVADEYLFNHVVRTLDQQAATNKPFFAHVMTTSNHRPYTYPNGRIDIPSPGGRDGGVKYTDYAIGQFIQDAKTKAWFKDTLFVIVADHCAAVAGKSKLPVDRYHIPLIFYAPDLIQPGHYQPIMSQMDIAPTLMDILDAAGGEQFFGQSVFSHNPPPERAFISNYQELGYYKKGILTVLLPKQKVESYQVDATTLATTPAPLDTQLVNEAIAYYQTAAKAYKTGALKAPYYAKAP